MTARYNHFGMLDAFFIYSRRWAKPTLSKCEIVRMGSDHPMDNVNLFQSHLHGTVVVPSAGRNVRRPKLGADAAFAQARNVGMKLRLATVDIDRLEREVLFRAKLPGKIVVAIDEDR